MCRRQLPCFCLKVSSTQHDNYDNTDNNDEQKDKAHRLFQVFKNTFRRSYANTPTHPNTGPVRCCLCISTEISFLLKQRISFSFCRNCSNPMWWKATGTRCQVCRHLPWETHSSNREGHCAREGAPQVQLCRQVVGTKGQFHEAAAGRHDDKNGRAGKRFHAKQTTGRYLFLT